ncbi:MAG: cyanophycinase [Phycisphaeraceae bacterium]|nr:cyanophycinase [Phycisphaeraceae bacterium]
MNVPLRVLVPAFFASVAALIGGCAAATDRATLTGLDGYLLAIGGGLDDDNKPVYELFVKRARDAAQANGMPLRIVIATAASGDQEANVIGKTQAIGAYAPEAEIGAIRRETPADEAIALIDGASAMFFTGGDQKRITAKYRPGDVDGPEMAALRRLLSRRGVIAGTSAGDAMMGEVMFLTGRSAEALGIRSTRTQRAEDDDPDEQRRELPLGPQIGPGMGLLPWAMTDSHFFERDRFGRLVAALEQSGTRLGIGVGEDAAVEIDLSTGILVGASVAESLLVDVGALKREGLKRGGIRAKVIRQGMVFSLLPLRDLPAETRLPPRPSAVEEVPVVEPGQNRQLASWRFFRRAEENATAAVVLKLDGYAQTAWPDGHGWSVVEVSPRE